MFTIRFRLTYFAVAILLLFSPCARAQMATAAFNPESTAFNPAAVATRENNILALQGETISDSDNYTIVKNKTQLNAYRAEGIYGQRFKGLAIEAYSAFITGSLAFDYEGAQTNSTQDVDLLFNELNMSVDLGSRIHLGVQYYNVQETYAYVSSGSAFKGNFVTGSYGAGLSVEPIKGFSLGAVYTSFGSGADSQTAFGASYTAGSLASHAFRMEFSYGTETLAEQGSTNSGPGIQVRGTLEVITSGFAGGVTILETENSFHDIRADLRNFFPDQSSPINEYVMSYDVYVGFKPTHGTSFSVHGSYSSGTSNTAYYNQQQTTDQSTAIALGATLAYIF